MNYDELWRFPVFFALNPWKHRRFPFDCPLKQSLLMGKGHCSGTSNWFFHMLRRIIPTDELIYSSEGLKPASRQYRQYEHLFISIPLEWSSIIHESHGAGADQVGDTPHGNPIAFTLGSPLFVPTDELILFQRPQPPIRILWGYCMGQKYG